MEINKFTIFGERNSGTKYIKKMLKQMLYLDYTKEYGFKHWYIKDLIPRGEINTTTDYEAVKSLNDSDDTLFIVIVRNPYDWVGSMYRRPYHMKHVNKNSIYDFITSKYISYGKRPRSKREKLKKSLWCENTNHKYPFFIEEADNLIALRNLKNDHFNNLKYKVKNYFLITQETLKNDLENMIIKFDLQYRFLDLPNYREPNQYPLDEKTIQFINENLDNYLDLHLYSNIYLKPIEYNKTPLDYIKQND